MTGFRTLGLKRTHDTLMDFEHWRVQRVDKSAPLGVSILFDVVFALAEGVPELDGAVTRARDDLTVVRAEADGEDVGGVANKAASGNAGVEVPEAEGVVP
jgi:hypothetical protein